MAAPTFWNSLPTDVRHVPTPPKKVLNPLEETLLAANVFAVCLFIGSHLKWA